MKLAIAVLAIALSGCVVAPVDPYYGNVQVQPAYVWEPSVNLWYYERRGSRYYQPRGWSHPGYGRGYRR